MFSSETQKKLMNRQEAMDFAPQESERDASANARIELLDVTPRILRLTITSERLTNDEFETIRGGLRRFVRCMRERPTPFRIIIDLSALDVLPVEHIVELNEYLDRKEKYLRGHLKCSACVVRNRYIKATFQTLMGMQGTWAPRELFVASSLHEVEKDVLAFLDRKS